MIGWIALLLLMVAVVLVLWLTRYPRKLWMIPATALMLGAAGYAWQGRPGLAGNPVSTEARKGEVDANLVAIRDAMFGKFGTNAWSYATAADRMTESGKPDYAVAVWQGAVRKSPGDAALWTGFGVALAEHDGMQVSPASKFAFERAMALWPEHPGPPFFYGLALIREGKFSEARPWWAKALERTPAKASYRGELAVRLMLLNRLLATKGAQ